MKGEPTQVSFMRALTAGLLFCLLATALLLILAPNHTDRIIAGVLDTLSKRRGEILTIGTASKRGAYYQTAAALEELSAGDGPYVFAAIETEGTLDNIQRLEAGAIDFAFIQGAPRLPDTPLVSLANIERQYVHLIVPAKSSIRSFADLAGKRIFLGPEKSGFHSLAKPIFAYWGFDPPVEFVHGPVEGLNDLFQQDAIDAAFTVFSLHTPILEDLFAGGAYRLVPIPQAESIAGYVPGVFTGEIPHSLYGPNRSVPTQDEAPFMTLSVNTVLVTRPDMPGRKVRAILKALYSVEFVTRARLAHLDETYGAAVTDLPLHKAARQYYARNNPVSSDKFEIASFWLAGAICFVSLVQYLAGRRRRRIHEQRRNAIIPYFKAMVTYGIDVEATRDSGKLLRIIHDMMSTQRNAERDWLDGKLDTEDMENLYSVYNIRSRNAFYKIFKLRLAQLNERSEATAAILEEWAKRNGVKPAAPRAKEPGDDEMLPDIIIPPVEREP